MVISNLARENPCEGETILLAISNLAVCEGETQPSILAPVSEWLDQWT